MRRVVLLLPLTLLAFGSAEAQGPASAPGAAASAWAVKVTPATGTGGGTPAVASPPNATPALGGAFSFPSDGSILTAQSTTASAVTKVERNAAALADSVTTSISIFGGEITADAVTARASAGTGPSGAGGNANGSGVANLKVGGQPVHHEGQHVRAEGVPDEQDTLLVPTGEIMAQDPGHGLRCLIGGALRPKVFQGVESDGRQTRGCEAGRQLLIEPRPAPIARQQQREFI